MYVYHQGWLPLALFNCKLIQNVINNIHHHTHRHREKRKMKIKNTHYHFLLCLLQMKRYLNLPFATACFFNSSSATSNLYIICYTFTMKNPSIKIWIWDTAKIYINYQKIFKNVQCMANVIIRLMRYWF